MDYAVVKFTSDSSYSEVPLLWLSEDHQYCYWPTKTKNPVNLMLKNIPPSEDWDKYAVEIESFCCSLESARRKALGCSTDEEGIENRGRGRRVKRMRHNSDTSDLSEACDSPPPQLEKRKKPLDDIQSKQKSPRIANIEDNIQPHLMTHEHGSNSTVTCSSGSSSFVSHSDIDKILVTCTTIKLYCESINKRLERLEEGKNCNDSYIVEKLAIEEKLPISNFEELQAINAFLEEGGEEKFVAFLRLIGGRDGKDFISRILRRLFRNQFAVNCSWLGRRNNLKISDTSVMKAIKVAVLSEFKELKENEFERISSEWFRLGKLRLRRENKK